MEGQAVVPPRSGVDEVGVGCGYAALARAVVAAIDVRTVRHDADASPAVPARRNQPNDTLARRGEALAAPPLRA